MSVSADYLTYVLDQFAPFAKVVSRRMFGGVGLYADGLFFGLIDDDVLYLKVDDSNREDYLARGAKPFQPVADDPTYSMSYFELPEDVLEDSDLLKLWARKSLLVASAKKQAKPRRKASRAGTTVSRVRKKHT
jgi:DNA transformation protein